MADLNHFFIIGRLVRDPELKSTNSGTQFCRFTLASDIGFGEHKKTGFFDCVAWSKVGEIIAKHTEKGRRIGVSGEIDFQSWEKDGKKMSKVEFKVEDFQFLDKKSDSSDPVKDGFGGTPAEPFNDDILF